MQLAPPKQVGVNTPAEGGVVAGSSGREPGPQAQGAGGCAGGVASAGEGVRRGRGRQGARAGRGGAAPVLRG